MPFATHYAKYYQNSIREEALVNNSRAGIIYGRGGGGTMREVFQDVERNYYATAARRARGVSREQMCLRGIEWDLCAQQ
jgi:hypothetical protein